ncbi:MAG TPA: hypothetical protein VLJ61_16000 [Pyrinomonadaceae bacterium]|nr:hypothetical protein [Pyrinomonadaceae bacterium]
MSEHARPGGTQVSSRQQTSDERRYAAWFHELDAWTEYWDVYHPETRGRFYFGDGAAERGLLTRFLPREGRPPAFAAWTRMALSGGDAADFEREARLPEVASAVLEVDALVARLFGDYFGDASNARVRADYLEAIFRFATDTLPPATERDARIPEDDPRKATAGRHTLDGDIMWFAWALQLEAARAIVGDDEEHARRSLQLAGVAAGCPANFAWRGHRRTRVEYRADDETAALLRERGTKWAGDFDAASREIHALFRIREWGSDE